MISTTDYALKKSVDLRRGQEHPEDWVLMIGVSGGGCSGFMYNLEFSQAPEDRSLYYILDLEDMSLYCDKKSYLFLSKTEIDYEESLMSSGFVFNNPLATRACGCGESIAFDMEKLGNE